MTAKNPSALLRSYRQGLGFNALKKALLDINSGVGVDE